MVSAIVLVFLGYYYFVNVLYCNIFVGYYLGFGTALFIT